MPMVCSPRCAAGRRSPTWPADGPGQAGATPIRGVLDAQVEAWNKGDLDGFMASYWDSDELTFYSGGTVTKGRKAVAERYRKTYQADGKEMGKLTFSELEVEILGPDTALVRGGGSWSRRRRRSRGCSRWSCGSSPTGGRSSTTTRRRPTRRRSERNRSESPAGSVPQSP